MGHTFLKINNTSFRREVPRKIVTRILPPCRMAEHEDCPEVFRSNGHSYVVCICKCHRIVKGGLR